MSNMFTRANLRGKRPNIFYTGRYTKRGQICLLRFRGYPSICIRVIVQGGVSGIQTQGADSGRAQKLLSGSEIRIQYFFTGAVIEARTGLVTELK